MSEHDRVTFERRLVDREREVRRTLTKLDTLAKPRKKRGPPPATITLGMPEKSFQRWVTKAAHLYGWHGWHVTFSKGAVTGVHTLGLGDDHYDSNGFPDCVFIRGRVLLFRELKAKGRYLTQDQKRWFRWLTEAGQDVDVWRPGDEEKVLATFRDAV